MRKSVDDGWKGKQLCDPACLCEKDWKTNGSGSGDDKATTQRTEVVGRQSNTNINLSSGL